MIAVILAGGLGSRLKPFTQVIPKPLLPVGEKSVLEIQINQLKKYGFKKIFLCTNYKSEFIERFFGDGSKYGVDLKISREKKALGTAGPLTILKDRLTEPFLLMNGDILTLVDFSKFYKFALKKNTILTIAIKKQITPFAFGNIFFKGDFVTSIQEKPDLVLYIIAGIYVIKPEIFDFIPQNKYYGMDTLIKKLIMKKIPIAKYEINEYWLDIGRLSDYEEAQRLYEEHFKEKN